jgi:LuxR family transcriptional regulator, maltose regulon positive regulatory protein
MSKACASDTTREKDNHQTAPEQNKHLLRTKLYIPAMRSQQVNRPRLITLLNGGRDKTLTLVSAPAGYGKTTMVSRWLKETGTAAAWLSLDAGDNDPIRFLQYLLEAIQTIAPGAAKEAQGILQGGQLTKYENVIDLLTNELAMIPDQFILVLDDFHVISTEAVLNIMLYLLEHLPPEKHVVLLTRIDPPLPLSRLRVRNQLLDIRADQLRFTSDEAAAFLNEVMGLTLSTPDLAAMETRTEGWIAGLQLAALSLQSCKDIHGFVAAFTGSHHYIMDYLIDEVLKTQSETTVTFLLQTSFLDHMCGPLCEGVINAEAGGQLNGQAMLETLEKMNLFVIPLDDERRWYRYHHLFADMLKKRLEQQYRHLIPELHRRASKWYEHNEFIAEAIEQAIAADEQDRAAQLIEENGCMLMMRGEVATFLNWTDTIDFQSETRPWLAIQKAWALALTGNPDRVEPTLQVPEKLLAPLEPTVEVKTLQGTMAAARAHCANTQGDTKSAAIYAHQALEKLPTCSAISRSIRSVATSVLGDASWINGDLDNAVDAYAEAIRIGREADNLHMVIIANSNLAEVLMEQGQLRRASEIYNQSLQMAVRPDGQRSPLASGIYAGLGRLAYEGNRLDEAAQNIQLSLDLCRQWGDLNKQAVVCALLARLEQVRHNPTAVLEAVRNVEKVIYERSLSAPQSNQVRSDLARTWLAQGNLERVSQLMPQGEWTIENEIPYQREAEFIILLRALLAQGDYDAALILSQRLLEKSEAAKRTGRVIEILVLQALTRQGRKETDEALAALKKAFTLAKPEGYVRTFLDEGEPLNRLLHLARSRQIETEYASFLLAAEEEAAVSTQPEQQNLAGPLTAREVEVLKLIEAGNANQEIAEKLVISITTVKRHISNIYTKLDVNNRTQAVAAAKELKLLT